MTLDSPKFTTNGKCNTVGNMIPNSPHQRPKTKVWEQYDCNAGTLAIDGITAYWCFDWLHQRPKSTTVSIGSNEMIEATKVKTFRCIGMQMVLATQLTPLPKQACLAKASCNLSTCSDLLGQCWLHVISMTSFFNGIQQFQGLCTLCP